MCYLFPPSEVSAYFLRQDTGQGYFYINENERKVIFFFCLEGHYFIKQLFCCEIST